MLYLHWFDDNPKKGIEQKIGEAAQAYQARFHGPPNVALVSEQDNAPAHAGGVQVRVEKRVGRNNIQVGVEG